jgi:hypothetical protein
MTRKRFSEEDGLGTEILFVEDFGLESQPAKAILITHLCYARLVRSALVHRLIV